jgi:hypothetical protein
MLNPRRADGHQDAGKMCAIELQAQDMGLAAGILERIGDGGIGPSSYRNVGSGDNTYNLVGLGLVNEIADSQ